MTGNPFWGEDWPEVRAAWPLDPTIAHLNHGSYGATPTAVLEAQARWLAEAEGNPNAFFGRRWRGLLDQARRRAAASVGADPDGFVLVSNVTAAVNTVLAGMALGAGDEVVVLDHGYGACRMAAERWCARVGARVVVAHVPMPSGSPDKAEAAVCGAVLDAVTSRARLAVVDHVTSPTALLLPVDRLTEELHARDVVVMVDGAHAPGMLDVDLAALGVDVWSGNFHKWACSPKSGAGFFVAAGLRDRLAPLVTSWFAADGFVESYSWAGTEDRTAWLAIPDALDFMSTLGWDRIRRHNAELVAFGARVVREAICTEPPVDDATAMVAPSMRLVELPAGRVTSPDEARLLTAQVAEELGCEVAVTGWNDRAFIRLSAQAYNCPADYERLAEGLPRVLP